MNRSDHERAIDLILMQDHASHSSAKGERLNGAPDESVWLDEHLSDCAECAEFAEALQLTAQAFRSAPVLASSSLVMDTQARVRARAAELQDQRNRFYLIGISFCLGLLWSAGNMFMGWKLSGWVAERFHVATWAVGAGIVLFWLLPAIAMAMVVVFHQRPTLGPDSALWRGVRSEGDWQ